MIILRKDITYEKIDEADNMHNNGIKLDVA